MVHLRIVVGDWSERVGAMEQLSLNVSAILLAGIGTLFIQRVGSATYKTPDGG